MSPETDITSKQHYYLAELYMLAQQHPPDELIPTSTLSNVVQDTLSNTARMIERLREHNLIEHMPYQGIRLLEDGEQLALQLLRKRRIINAFLVEVMDFHWYEVYPEAIRMETAIDQKTIQRMWIMSGMPDYDPFGEPIPDLSGRAVPVDDICLTQAAIKQDYIISRILTREIDRLEYLDALHLRPTTSLHLLHRAPFDGPLQLQLGREFRIIGHELASHVYVQTAPLIGL